MGPSQYVVVGAGLAGAATAWSLARQDHEVTVVERAQPAAHDGSSHGSARIFRYAYPEAFYTRLVVQARQRWDELERLSRTELITRTGSLDFGVTRNPRTLAGVLEAEGVEHELLDLAEARSRWPQIAVDSETLWHPAAGVIDSETAVRAMLDQATAHGARLLTDWELTRTTRTRNGFRLTAADGAEVDAEKVVVAAGGWLPHLLADLELPSGFLSGLPPLQVSQEQAYHFPYRDDTAEWPTFIHKSPAIQAYSLPGGRDAGFRGQKLAEYNAGPKMSSAAHQTGTIDPANRARLVDYVTRFLPGLVPEPYAETTCLFTNTPTEDFVVDGVDGVTVVSACSGHGAKFAPLVGDIAADVATGSAAAPDRFRVGAGAREEVTGRAR
ncbi:FAD-dependent oxidoreductase [Geodermatophilus normandii]|uniref:FAD-dependent oxidoreductase n=1 Tax=Geodermatophilus normandii TaxID=1137989 RepID=A0A6P0GIT2_9ACTN|nr:FAD-dependent oxidoreductase [Geodermatophilus normandii]